MRDNEQKHLNYFSRHEIQDYNEEQCRICLGSLLTTDVEREILLTRIRRIKYPGRRVYSNKEPESSGVANV